ncbi:hypothetical protein Ani05nite_21570 [Amorphoplanes nipponensis]|uniref:Uncharacterized protein n=1 Tax=Actinoplanes nipponensis TaxID=135950 RepID=A0A919JF50_9ACTN|nr:hypothetical protein Ani05nite_21570 [Actinoplanes nipponensis]
MPPITWIHSSAKGCHRNSPYDTVPSQCAVPELNTALLRVSGPKAIGSTSSTANVAYSSILRPNSTAVGSARSRGPAIGVVAMASTAAAAAQQASGAPPRSSRKRQRGA